MDIPFVSKGEDEQTDMNNLTRLLEQLIDSEEENSNEVNYRQILDSIGTAEERL